MITVECPHCHCQIEANVQLEHVRFRCACDGQYILVYREGRWQATLPTPTPEQQVETWKGSKNV
jgi:hypothetical protein